MINDIWIVTRVDHLVFQKTTRLDEVKAFKSKVLANDYVTRSINQWYSKFGKTEFKVDYNKNVTSIIFESTGNIIEYTVTQEELN